MAELQNKERQVRGHRAADREDGGAGERGPRAPRPEHAVAREPDRRPQSDAGRGALGPGPRPPATAGQPAERAAGKEAWAALVGHER
eukprot:9736052-Lingulodinium_polyedra.AAC.1